MQDKSTFNDLSNIHLVIHHATLNPHQTLDSFYESCDCAKHFNFGGFSTDLSKLCMAKERIGKASHTKVIAAISFPFGSIPSSLKRSQAEWAIEHGAEELEVVPNFFALSQGKTDLFGEELALICELGIPVRVIINVANLPENILSTAISSAIDAGISSVQSGNGFGKPVNDSDIKKIDNITKGRCSIKAVGGIRKISHLSSLLEAGANIIGTSYGQELIEEIRGQQN